MFAPRIFLFHVTVSALKRWLSFGVDEAEDRTQTLIEVSQYGRGHLGLTTRVSILAACIGVMASSNILDLLCDSVNYR